MEYDLKVQTDGVKWLRNAGLAAVLVALFLVWVDYTLITSDSEERLAETLYELRTAQSSLGSGGVDERMLEPGEMSKSNSIHDRIN